MPHLKKPTVTAFLLLFALCGCNKSGDEAAAFSPAPTPVISPTFSPLPLPSPSPAPVTVSTSCTSAVIDGGQKGTGASSVRGGYSDTKLIPGTGYTATAYIDPSSLTMKLTFATGVEFNTEVISGDVAAAWVRLGFLSSGIPIVLWASGTSVKAAIRTAAIGAPGTWRSSIVDTGTAPRAIELSINPQDQVAVTFLTDTAVTGRPKFLYCDAPCTSPAGFQTMNSNPYLEATNLTAAQTATGAGWCKASASTYYPAAAYSVTGAVRYAICANTLANCLNGANWTATNVVAAANLGTKLLLDSNVVGDIPKAVSAGGAGIVPYRMGTTACNSAISAFTAGAAIGTASSGTLWMSFLKDSAGKFHLFANEATSSVRYYNSSSTDAIGLWNAAGIVETANLAPASAGGASLDSVFQAAYVSYGAFAVPYDLKLGRVNDYTQASSAVSLTRYVPDLTGNLQLTAASSQLKSVASASTSTGKPGVAYVDFSVGSAAGAKLKYGYRPGGTATSPWEGVLIPDTINPQFPGLAFDTQDRPWISYFEAATNRFFLTTNSATDGSGSWATYEFPATPAGAPLTLPSANNTALAMYRHAGVSDPVMLVIDTNASSKGVKASVFSSTTRRWTNASPVTLDTLAAGSLAAAHLSVDADAAGDIVAAYQDLNLTRVKYVYSANGGISWSSPLSVSSVGQGPGVSIKLSPTDGHPAMSYYDQANNLVVINNCATTPAACASGGWNPLQVEGAAGVSALAVASGQLLSTALNFSVSGSAYLFFPRGQGNDGNLLLTNNAAGSFVSTPVAYGSNASLPGAAALNFAVAGWNVASSPNAAGSFTAEYIGPGNWLYALSCGD